MSSTATKPKQIDWTSLSDVEAAVQDFITRLAKELQGAHSAGNNWKDITARDSPRDKERLTLLRGLKRKWTDTTLKRIVRQHFYGMRLRLVYVQNNLLHIVNQDSTVLKVVNGDIRFFASLCKPLLPSKTWQDAHIPLSKDSPLLLLFEANFVFVLTHAGHHLSTYEKDVLNMAQRWDRLRFSRQHTGPADQLQFLVNTLFNWGEEMARVVNGAVKPTDLETFYEAACKAACAAAQQPSVPSLSVSQASSSGQTPVAGPSIRFKDDLKANKKRTASSRQESDTSPPPSGSKRQAGSVKGKGKGKDAA